MSDNPTPPPAPPPMNQPNESQVRTWHMWAHLSALAGYIVPFGNILGPLIIWQMKKGEIPSVESHAKAAMNFQITVLIGVIACIILGVLLSFICIGFLLFPVAGILGICGLVFAIIAGLKANEGKEYKYPYSLNLIK